MRFERYEMVLAALHIFLFKIWKEKKGQQKSLKIQIGFLFIRNNVLTITKQAAFVTADWSGSLLFCLLVRIDLKHFAFAFASHTSKYD